MKRIIPTKYDGILLREYLHAGLLFSSRLIKRIISTGGKFIINGNEVTVRYRLKSDDHLQIIFPKEQRSPSIVPENLPLQILYEDDALLIINKPAGMPSMPSSLHLRGTVANRLLAYYDANDLHYTVHIVTRLDRDTSGLMLIAKHQYSHSLLSQMQRHKLIDRTYEAIVHGIVENPDGTINKPIGRKETSIIERIVTEKGQEAVTHYHVLNRYETHTYVNIRLETGRTHQIRVHFSSVGHPLLGDDLYGGKQDLIKRQALHCSKIAFNHPMTDEEIVIDASLPADMKNLLTK